MNVAEHDADRIQTLRKRAEALAARQRTEGRRALVATIALVSVGEERLGIPVDGLREIARTPAIAGLPGLPPWLLGVAQVRGETLCVVQLGRLLEVDKPGSGAYLAVVENRRGTLGLLVDSVLGFQDVFEDEIADDLQLPAAAGSRPIRATTRDLVTILDLQGLFADSRLIVDDFAQGQARG